MIVLQDGFDFLDTNGTNGKDSVHNMSDEDSTPDGSAVAQADKERYALALKESIAIALSLTAKKAGDNLAATIASSWRVQVNGEASRDDVLGQMSRRACPVLKRRLDGLGLMIAQVAANDAPSSTHKQRNSTGMPASTTNSTKGERKQIYEYAKSESYTGQGTELI